MALVGLEGNADPPRERVAVRTERLGRFQTHQTGLTLDIPLPAAHRHCPATLHEKAVANVDLVGRRQRWQTRRVAIERHAHAQAAIDHVVQQAAIAAFALGWSSTKSAQKRTFPAASRGALSRSTMRALAGWPGSTAKCSWPSIRS